MCLFTSHKNPCIKEEIHPVTNSTARELVLYFSGREPYPYTKVSVYSNKTFFACNVEDHYAGAGDSGTIPKELLKDNQLTIKALFEYINKNFSYMNLFVSDDRIIDFSNFTMTKK